MNTYFLDGQKLITDLRLNRIYEVSRAVISYPYSFTNKIRRISQEFIIGADNVPAFDPSLTHPTYNQAYIVNQTEAQIEPAGFCKFTREYIEYTGGEITTNPTSLSFTFPSIWEGSAPFLRQNGGAVSATNFKPIRYQAITTNVSVYEKWELINVSAEEVDTETARQDIPVGSKIRYGGYDWTLVQNNGTGLDIERYDTNTEQTIGLSVSSGYDYLNSNPDFEKIAKVQPFSVYDNINQTAVDTYLGTIGLNENPARIAVDYVDDLTIPNTETYLKDVAEKNKFPMQESEIEHLGGYVYIRKTLYGKLI